MDSMTTWAPTEAQSSLEGSFSAKTWIVLPSTVMESGVAEMLFVRLPRMGAYFERCASVFGLVRSLTATNSRPGSFEGGAEDVAADAAKAVDACFDCHFASLENT